MGLAAEYETSAEACAGTTTIETVTYIGTLQVGTLLSNFGGVSGNTGFFKITSNPLEPQYVGTVIGINDNSEVDSMGYTCTAPILCFSYVYGPSNTSGTIYWTNCNGTQGSTFVNSGAYHTVPCMREGTGTGFGTWTKGSTCSI
jgi:hypothetical protein